MLKRLAPLAIAGTVGFLLVSLLNGGTLASTVSTTSDQVKLINYTNCLTFRHEAYLRFVYDKGNPGYERPFIADQKECALLLK
jgi:hypothetical protein